MGGALRLKAGGQETGSILPAPASFALSDPTVYLRDDRPSESCSALLEAEPP